MGFPWGSLVRFTDWRPVEVLLGREAGSRLELIRLGSEYWLRLEDAGRSIVFAWLAAGLFGFIFGLICGFIKWGPR